MNTYIYVYIYMYLQMSMYIYTYSARDSHNTLDRTRMRGRCNDDGESMYEQD